MSLQTFAKTYWNIIVITFLIVLGVVIFFYVRNIQGENDSLKQQLEIVKIQKPNGTIVQVQRYKDSSGASHVIINAEDNKVPQSMIDEGSAVKIGLLDTVSTALKLAKDEINQITRINFSLSGNNVLLQKKIDSLSKKVTYVYRDKHLNYSEVDLNDSTRQGRYTYNGDLQYVDYSKKKLPIIGQTYNYTDIYSTDTAFKINSVNRLTIQHNTKIWSFNLKAHTAVFTNTFSIGARAELGYKNFTLSYGRYYNVISGNRINPISLDYTLIGY